ncbi:uncharacterized protein AMSG_02968 [Thecamonas trahens ATCC 50062]|uniref:Nudix hydrolase domain-containing protein n=1 Tax=Thecamonas trahens ATCC 50062 TaxID=461836 RepID=A0A0L0D2K1_THETB|nr:hypothetical protein AMSG_02968 [Thecamonas trahens ATCC 50062]KNC46532.1 hypothetical protein AMSG_02968 [Thecamonas trahens ATCC 50062]|eukprot:XP_013760313.1 hypothetical protein AMSG_02968 [Thecamonas trahens ATCC 50062]
MDAGQVPEAAAHRETMEEAGVAIELKGVLRVEQSPRRLRFIFAASPIDPEAKAKSVADAESNGGAWLTLEQLADGRRLRGSELCDWGRELVDAGATVDDVAPLAHLVTAAGVPDGELVPTGVSLEDWILGSRPKVDSVSVLGSPELMSIREDGWTRRTGCPVAYSYTVLVRTGGDDGTITHALSAVPFEKAGLILCAAADAMTEAAHDAPWHWDGVLRIEYLLHGVQSASFHAVLVATMPDLDPGTSLPPLTPRSALYAELTRTLTPVPVGSFLTHEGADIDLHLQ